MIEVTTSQSIPLQYINSVINNAIGYVIGMSGGWFGTIAYLPDTSTQADIDTVQSIFNSYGTAPVEAVPVSITANDTDVSTITALVNASNTYVMFTAFDTDNIMQMESDPIATSAGVAEYEFKTALPGLYTIRCYGTITNETGFVDVEAI